MQSRRNGRKQQRDAGLDKAARRLAVQLDSWRDQERNYSAYTRALSKLLALEPNDFDRHRLTAEDLIPKRAMGDSNSVYDIQNYVVGPWSARSRRRFRARRLSAAARQSLGAQQRAGGRGIAPHRFPRDAHSHGGPSGFSRPRISKP